MLQAKLAAYDQAIRHGDDEFPWREVTERLLTDPTAPVDVVVPDAPMVETATPRLVANNGAGFAPIRVMHPDGSSELLTPAEMAERAARERVAAMARTPAGQAMAVELAAETRRRLMVADHTHLALTVHKLRGELDQERQRRILAEKEAGGLSCRTTGYAKQWCCCSSSDRRRSDRS